MQLLATLLMYANVVQGLLLLMLVRKVYTPALGGLRWMLRCLAVLPLTGLTLNVVRYYDCVDPPTLALVRSIAGYGIINLTLGGMIVWLVRQHHVAQACSRSLPS